MSTLARTLEAVDILQKHNFTKQEAQKVIDIMQGISATREDLLKAETRLKEDMHALDKKIDSVAFSLKEEIQRSASTQTKWMFGMLFTVVLVILGLLKL